MYTIPDPDCFEKTLSLLNEGYASGMAMDEVHRCAALVPWLSSEEDAAARSEGGEFRTDFASDGMVDEHGSHGES